MLFRLGYGLYGLGLAFYILFLRGSDRLARECRPDEPAGSLPGASWLALWREHRVLFPKSSLRRGLVLRVLMLCVFVAGGTVLTSKAPPRSSSPQPPRSPSQFGRRHSTPPTKPSLKSLTRRA